MKLKKKISLFLLALSVLFTCTRSAFAQQDPMYTQYMDNLQIINPAFTGSQELGSVLLVARNQWVAFEGAPQTRTFSFHTPLKTSKIGLGFSLLNDRIGPLNQTGVYFDYSYFLKVGFNYRLGMGLKGGFSFYRALLADLQTVSPDPIYARDIYKNFLPNFGVGTFLFSNDNYFGFSVPKLIENSISRDDYSSEYVNREKIHVYLVAGKEIGLSQDLKLKSHSMLKLIKNAPASIDLTAMLGIRERFWFGGMFRIGDSYGILAQFNPNDKILIGYSYDLTFSGLNAFNNGTHEVMLRYNIQLFPSLK